ncbi:hypothetical protein [Amycolatopsis sp. DG1A-15b]|uniref:hypothetical protein n=1 Tax=Amycolatopsis sp. DG1A-15b TaxID=3052846 RepID=UPI00255C1C36|nr:hypothetical protein [Amycolatopsis sp. DG1A-15b]WIX93248.1 hypothetical protein QRY02_23495 [Amycolatopsis sp. DG1A-15b]
MTARPETQRRRAGRTAIGRAHGRHRTFLIATCVALVLAAISDEATGYDGPGPFICVAFALVVALIPWRFTPLLATVMSALFLYGGLASSEFVGKLIHPNQVLDFTAGWVQMGSFVAVAVFSVASVGYARRAVPSHS